MEELQLDTVEQAQQMCDALQLEAQPGQHGYLITLPRRVRVCS